MRDLAQDLALAQQLADIADVITRDRYQSLDLVIETKPDLTPVTDADKSVEAKLREVIAANRPDDLVVGEEFGTPALTADNYTCTRPQCGNTKLCTHTDKVCWKCGEPVKP